MTSYAGYTISATECCGARYAIRRYRSINFSSSCYWTDGYRENSLMPNDHGLRQCKCGVFFLQKDLVEIDQVQESELPSPARVEPSNLAIAIQQASNEKIEVAARLDYWHHLNHHYRNLYRIHRDAEEQEAREKWETAIQTLGRYGKKYEKQSESQNTQHQSIAPSPFQHLLHQGNKRRTCVDCFNFY